MLLITTHPLAPNIPPTPRHNEISAPGTCAGVFRFVCNLPDTEVFDDYALAIKWLLREGWIQPTSSQPEDAGRNQADEHPKQIRA